MTWHVIGHDVGTTLFSGNARLVSIGPYDGGRWYLSGLGIGRVLKSRSLLAAQREAMPIVQRRLERLARDLTMEIQGCRGDR